VKRSSLHEIIEQALATAVGGPVSQSFTAGDPPQVVVGIHEKTISVGAYVGSWSGPHTPTHGSDYVGEVEIDELAADRNDAKSRLAALIGEARQKRLGSFARCGECEQDFPPEWMHDEGLCQSCAERNHGVTY
jgi:hypothetical protein